MIGGSEICAMDAVTLAARVRAKELSPVEIVDAALHRLDALEPKIHAFCTATPELARQAARRLETEIVAGKPVGALAGVPVAVKDTIFTKGVRTAQGSIAYVDFVPDEDDVVVERLLAADALLLGKTNVPEFAYAGVGHNPVFETTRNPWNPERTSGGSSAGSAAAVACGMAPLAVGSDAGGSIRIPAAFCGLFGMKASWGRVPLYPGCRDERYPGASSWEYLEHVGPLSRTVADGALMLSVIAGPDDRDRHSIPTTDVDWLESARGERLEGVRVAFSADLGYAVVDPEVRDIAARAAAVFERELGCQVVEAHPDLEDAQPTFWALVALNSDLRGMRALAEKHGENMSPHLLELLDGDWQGVEFTDALQAQKRVCNKMWRFMRGYDLLITPTVAVAPFALHIRGPQEIAGREVSPVKWTALTFPMNMTGQPAATVPAGWTSDGLPVGLQIAGRHLDDALVLRASAAFERAAPWRDRWPPLVAEVSEGSG